MSVQRLREYIDNDKTYQNYKMKKPVSEYIRFHIALCEDIENVLDALDEIREYVIKHRQIYDIDGSIEKQIDEFDVLASPKKILQIIDKVKENE